MDKQKIKSVPRLTTNNPGNNFQTDRRVHLRQNRQARPRRNDDGHKHFDIGRVV